ncbi:MAG: SIMPL domain-containing protein [Bacteroidota bacterium]
MQKKTLLSLLLIAAVALLAVSAITAKDAPRHLTVSGEASVKAVPDRVRLTLGVEADGQTARAAQAAVAGRITAVLKALGGQGVEEKAIRTRTLSLIPLRDYNPKDGRETLRGYRAANQVEVTVTDLQKAGSILDAAVAAGANTAGEIQFYLDDPAALRAAALAEAFKDAERRAASLAASSGQKIIGAVSISETAVSAPQAEAVRLAKFGLGDAAAATPVEPGQVAVQAKIRVRFGTR